MKFSIDEPIYSGNVILRQHWATRRRLLTRYEWQIHSILGPVPLKFPSRKMKVRIVSYRARLLDKDNLYSGAKILIDALRRSRLIRDDSPRWLELEVEQEVDGKNMRTEIEVRGLRA